MATITADDLYWLMRLAKAEGPLRMSENHERNLHRLKEYGWTEQGEQGWELTPAGQDAVEAVSREMRRGQVA